MRFLLFKCLKGGGLTILGFIKMLCCVDSVLSIEVKVKEVNC